MDSEPARRSFLRRRWPLLLILLVLAGLFTYLALASTTANEGSFTYTLDDAYIHLAVARSLAVHGDWGVDQGRFDSVASSLGWPLLLALATLIFGNAVLAPLILAVIAAGALFWIMEGYLDRRGVEAPYRLLIYLAAWYISSLTFGLFSGMEHVLHLLAAGTLLIVAPETLDEGRRRWGRSEWTTLVLAAAAVALRYEALFAVAALVLLALLRKRWLFAVALTAAGWLPVVAYGLLSTANGAFFLPNSILIKSSHSGRSVLETLLGNTYLNLIHKPFLLGLSVLALGGGIWHWRRNGFWHPVGRFNTLVLVTTGLCVVFVNPGFRYFIWILFLLVLAVALTAWSLAEPLRKWLAGRPLLKAIIVGLAGLFVFYYLAVKQPGFSLQATRNIYRQQRQTARFLDRYYAGEAVAVNDIGAVAYYADVEVIDLWGLASQEVAELKLAGAYDSAAIERLVAESGAACAVVYNSWFDKYGGLPADWIACARWTIPHNVVCGDDDVFFYAFDEAGAAALRKHLDEFVPELPPEVVVTSLNDAQP